MDFETKQKNPVLSVLSGYINKYTSAIISQQLFNNELWFKTPPTPQKQTKNCPLCQVVMK